NKRHSYTIGDDTCMYHLQYSYVDWCVIIRTDSLLLAFTKLFIEPARKVNGLQNPRHHYPYAKKSNENGGLTLGLKLSAALARNSQNTSYFPITTPQMVALPLMRMI